MNEAIPQGKTCNYICDSESEAGSKHYQVVTNLHLRHFIYKQKNLRSNTGMSIVLIFEVPPIILKMLDTFAKRLSLYMK